MSGMVRGRGGTSDGIANGGARTLAARVAASAVIAVARLVTGVRGVWLGSAPSPQQRIYFANHASHGDFVLIWTALPPALRSQTRPVAGADYWSSGHLRPFIGREVFNAVLIERTGNGFKADPLAPVRAALRDGSSLIVFPEGTRNTTEMPLLPLKSGIYHLARDFPQVPLVPIWIENIGRVMPKGEVLPVPLLCRVVFGAPMKLAANETRDSFIKRAASALLDLRPGDGEAR